MKKHPLGDGSPESNVLFRALLADPTNPAIISAVDEATGRAARLRAVELRTAAPRFVAADAWRDALGRELCGVCGGYKEDYTPPRSYDLALAARRDAAAQPAPQPTAAPTGYEPPDAYGPALEKLKKENRK